LSNPSSVSPTGTGRSTPEKTPQEPIFAIRGLPRWDTGTFEKEFIARPVIYKTIVEEDYRSSLSLLQPWVGSYKDEPGDDQDAH